MTTTRPTTTPPDVPACEYGMSGWCGQLGNHDRCFFSSADGGDAARAGHYGLSNGHQWICSCPCHRDRFPPCPHPDHHGTHIRRPAQVDRPIQLSLF